MERERWDKNATGVPPLEATKSEPGQAAGGELSAERESGSAQQSDIGTPEASIIDEGTWELIRLDARDRGLPEEVEVQRAKELHAELLRQHPDLEQRFLRLREEIRSRVRELLRELPD